MPCNHPEALNSRRNRHACDTTSPVITKVVDICHKVAYSSIGIIHRCHTLSAQRASEVLVYMLCDLDRMSKPELPHAFPIGKLKLLLLQSISTYKDDFVHLNIDTYETLDAEVQLPTASVSNETIGVDYTGGTDQAMDEGIVDESHETVESGDGSDLYAQFISATGVTYNGLLDSLLSKDRKTKVTKDNFLQYFESVGRLSAGLTKAEILICLDRIKLEIQQMYFAKSWNKQKLAQYLYNCLTDQSNLSGAETNRKRE
ncbi:unnamed protein product [Mytilus edulis]|uniref:Uncharacterized protein n=1 Tax=Mytilus edulis TaxID=6550 RepID=A0A8S3SYX7_MYTED|nr:unnamed protein product [Mytilus edulis]